MKPLLTLALLIGIQTGMFGQTIFKVVEGDTSKMVYENREWVFRDNLADGYYKLYRCSDSSKLLSDFFIVNGKKQGLENEYFYNGKPFASINWDNDKKTGVTYIYNCNGTIAQLMTFKNDTLDGKYESNWTEGKKNYAGWFKNGVADSSWLYFDYKGESQDSNNIMVSKELYYKNGVCYLMNMCDKNGQTVIQNGNGEIIDSSFYYEVKRYCNGLKNGLLELDYKNGAKIKEEYYEDDKLIKGVYYYENNVMSNSSEWCYPFEPTFDTFKTTLVNSPKIIKDELKINYNPVKNGHWSYYYPDGNIAMDGNFARGNKIGIWNWYYQDGTTRLKVDYAEETWEHFNKNGELISEEKYEYLTLFTGQEWYLNQPLDTSEIILTDTWQPGNINTLYFRPNEMLHFYCWECEPNMQTYSVLLDELTIYLTYPDSEFQATYKFHIVAADNKQIVLKRIY